jgi:hypothetical protein
MGVLENSYNSEYNVFLTSGQFAKTSSQIAVFNMEFSKFQN